MLRKYQLQLAVLLVTLVSEAKATITDDEDYCIPQHVHLSYGSSLDEMVIVWATAMPCSTEVLYGISPWNLDQQASGTSIIFSEQNFQGLQDLHRVKLKSLAPSTTYYYRPLSNNIGKGPFYFKTPPTGTNWAPQILFYGDLGVHTETIPSLAREALKGEYTAIIHAGDFAYNLKDNNGQVGDQFMQLIEQAASFLPYMTCPGNHEIDSDSFAHYRHRFSMPVNEWPMPLEQLWYSFDVGPVHFVSYSSEVFFTLGGTLVQTQYDWLVNDLSKANQNRREQPWIIAYGHRPMYCSAGTGDDCTMNSSLVRTGFEELFYHYGVDLVLQAHEHNYERLYPMFKGVVLSTNYTDPRAPVQIISGAAGSKHGVDLFQPPPQPDWSAVRVENDSLNSYGRLLIANATHMYWEQRAVNNNTVLDSLWVVQRYHGKFDLQKLPQDVTHQIHQNMEAAGETPGVLHVKDPADDDAEIVNRDKTQRLAISISFGAVFVILILAAILYKVCRRRHYTLPRRWELVNVDYGKPYQPLNAEEEEEEDQIDLEIDMADSQKIHSKMLLNNGTEY